MRYYIQLVENLLIKLLENYRLVTKDQRGNFISADKVMSDIDIPKAIYKRPPIHREQFDSLWVFPIYRELDDDWILFLQDEQYKVREKYENEAAPIVKFILSQYPQYSNFKNDTDITLQEFSQNKRARPEEQQSWYHGTSSLRLPAIFKMGLLPQNLEDRLYRGIGASDRGVYLARDADIAQMHAENAMQHFGGAPVVLKINLKGLEDKFRNDGDVERTVLGSKRISSTKDERRIKTNPGQASYLQIGTIAFAGRIPPNRISIEWQGKETNKKAITQNKSEHFDFINQLSRLAGQLNERSIYDFCIIVGARPAGWSGRKPNFQYKQNELAQLVHSVYNSKGKNRSIGASKYKSWINGMFIRSRNRWKRSIGVQANIRDLIASERQRLFNQELA